MAIKAKEVAKNVFAFARETVAGAFGHGLAGRILGGEVERAGKPREKYAFECTLDRLPAEGDHGVRAAQRIRAWHRLIQHRMQATYNHPRTGQPFNYGPFYEDGAVNALNGLLEAMPNDRARVNYMLGFGNKTDAERDDVIHGLTGDRFFQLLSEGWDQVNRAARAAATQVDAVAAWGQTLPGGTSPANPNVWWRRVWRSWWFTLAFVILITLALLLLGARS